MSLTNPPLNHSLVDLGLMLQDRGYHFVTPTPETLRRVWERTAKSDPLGNRARSLRDVFGYSRPFTADLLPKEVMDALMASGAFDERGNEFVSKVRYSSLGGDLYVHSAYPTESQNAVFFGPDTYRFCHFLRRFVQPCQRVVDIGAGSGAGGISLRSMCNQVSLVDVNQDALRFSAVNTALAKTRCELLQSDVLSQVEGDIDLIISNPPYMKDPGSRAYRDGGGCFGEALSLRIVEESLSRLSSNGKLLLYTGTAIVDGQDIFWQSVRPLLDSSRMTFDYEELDPDVFGEELLLPGYERVERIAVVGLVVKLC